MTRRAFAAGLAGLLASAKAAMAYPLDGYESTGIRRLLGYRLAMEGKLARGINIPPGGRLGMADIKLTLKGVNDSYDVSADTPRDPKLQQGLERVFSGRDPSYSLALLDITNPREPRFAELRSEVKRIPGSLGKLLVATGFFEALRLRFPDDTDARRKFLKDTVIAADSFVHRDGKTVPFFEPGGEAVVNRRIETGDRFSLYEWLDHMLSQSSNAAASMTWKQAMLLRELGAAYPSAEAERKFFEETSKPDLLAKSLEVNEAPLRAAGIDTDNLRIGTFFTNNASRVIPGTASYASPLELMRWLVRLQQGRIVDPWSSLEIKKLIYFSRPRYRYASSPALVNAPVFFKSGSLFHCVPEEGFTCKAYAGNKLNLMHSVAIVESKGKTYMVTMTTNVLRVNGAVEHQTVAGLIEKLMQSDS